MKNKRVLNHKFLNSGENEKIKGKWSEDEQNKFLNALKLYGKNWKKIEEFIKTRTASQIRSHAQKFFNKNSHLLKEYKLDQIIEENLTDKYHLNLNEKEEKLNLSKNDPFQNIEEYKNQDDNISNNSDSDDQLVKANIDCNDSISEEVIDISKENNNNYITKNQIFKSFIEQMKIIISEIKGNSDIEKKIKIMEIWKDITLNIKNMYKTFKNEDDNFNGKWEYNSILNEIKILSKELKFNIQNPYLVIYNDKEKNIVKEEEANTENKNSILSDF